VFALLIGLPLALVLVQAVMPGLFAAQDGSSTLSFEPLARVFNSPHVAGSVLHSLELGMLVACTTTALGGAFAVLVQRCDIPLRTAISMVPWLVFLTPSYLKALAWVLLMSPNGYLALISLSPRWEQTFAESMVGEGDGRTLAMQPSKLSEFVSLVRERFEEAGRQSESPVLLASAAARPFVRSIVERFRPQTTVLSQSEIHPRIRLKTIGSV